MLFAEVICTLGLMAPQSCLPADPVQSVNIVCDKHETLPGHTNAAAKTNEVVSVRLGIDQTCKAERPVDAEASK